MPIRPLKLPRDAKLLSSLLVPAFQYPDHPEWGVQADEVESMADQLRGVRRIWPLLAPLRLFSAPMRDVLRGVICEEDGTPVGVTFVMRQGASDRWSISNVAVLPEYRRRGIAQRMVRAAVDMARDHGARLVDLAVIAGNTPAIALYEHLGFERFDERVVFERHGADMVAGRLPPPALPPGYRFEEIAFTRWRERYDLARRTTPAAVTHYRPVEPEVFRMPPVLRGPVRVLGPLTGNAQRQVVVREQQRGGQVVGVATYSVRTRAGGVAFCEAALDPARAVLAVPLLSYVALQVTRHSPGRRLEGKIAGWQDALLAAAPEVGLREKLRGFEMGLRLSPATGAAVGASGASAQAS